PARLLRIDARSGEERAADFDAPTALCADGDGAALVLETARANETFLWRVDAYLERTLLGAFPGACALAARPGEILVGCADGELVLVRADGAVVGLATWLASVRALACGP